MTRTNVIQFGLLVLGAGAIGYFVFRAFGFESINAGIAAESVLILGVLLWTCSYLFRVFTGKMTFVEQRRRYQQAFEDKNTPELLARFELMSDEEKNDLLKDSKRDNLN